MEDGEVLFGLRAIAGELTRLTGKEIPEKRAAYWAKRGVFRSRKYGHFVVTTKTDLQASFKPEAA
jgi:hypothetical protein